MADEIDKQRLLAAKAELVGLVGAMPQGIGSWSYNRSRDFKEAHKKAAKVAAGKSVTIDKIREAISLLTPFHKGPP